MDICYCFSTLFFPVISPQNSNLTHFFLQCIGNSGGMMMAPMMAGNEAVGELFELWWGIKSFGFCGNCGVCEGLRGLRWGVLENGKGMGSNLAFSGLWRYHPPSATPHFVSVPQIQTLFFPFFFNLFQINWVVREAICAKRFVFFAPCCLLFFAPHTLL